MAFSQQEEKVPLSVLQIGRDFLTEAELKT